MRYIEHNKAARCVVGKRENGRFPLTVTFELCSEVSDTVKDLEELEAFTERYEVPGPPVFRQRARHQLHEQRRNELNATPRSSPALEREVPRVIWPTR